ncbi:CubicO group peptidase (beta-lactamase class C family) [Tahibacter aquaticus]|uniref:CubicO group peptidase (Beta-lactamase class C family) n=1 Tax=Tahibacter aquaticus TaxID=520092 RepID=A0A4R6Z7S2_9GAMM|nr:serine hydrolase [Tahibacter aquaticus]TDR47639.1 CubicO group peptidase (beta-lactamase class C family) [Tahibacter aquaticus]
MKQAIGLALCMGFVATPLAAQQKAPEGYERAIAAGYKALTLCSVLFNAGRSEAQAATLELKGIYAEYDAIVPTLAASVDSEARVVSVAFDDRLPPRMAAWRPNLGCAQIPVGAGHPALAALPRLDAPAPALDSKPWPLGERAATGRLKGDRKQLRRGIDAAFAGTSFGEGIATTAVLVVQNGRIVAEQYRDGFGPHVSQRTWSVAKSLAGTLIGVAAGEGRIDPARPAPIAQWMSPGDPRAAITTDNLLRMASGLHSSTAGNRTDALYFGGAAVSEETVAWPLLAPPGTRYRYANNDTVLAMLGLRTASGDEAKALAFPFTALLWKIGMTRTVPETDWKGNFMMSSQVWTTARDLARLGLLYQDDGLFLGQRVLPQGWRDYVTQASGPQPAQGPFGYGATFWLMSKSPGIPADTFAAIGNRGQFLVIVPSRKVVIVRRGEDPGAARFDIAAFTAQVLAALH